ncbi:MAG: hypothetical protein KAS63_05250 [Candidatus Heimdallarchaeota archaeon]|nr:hypothetical protein [Candidatus Heimdallarchaeota archaeon]MCK4954743.1 hypothetical protein [Candidatus Heimdallarchaeota archaeon]
MEETHQKDDTNSEQESEVILPPSISDGEKGILFKELTTILSRKWEKEKTIVFGSSELDLLLATGFDIRTLRDVIEEYKNFVQILGLEVIEFIFNEERWYCLKTNYYAPSELQQSELIVLGIVVGFIEEDKTKPITTERIKEKLVVMGKMKEYLVDTSLRKLSRFGYLQRIQNEWSYNYRTLIEFGEEERKKIAEEFRRI